MRKFAEGERVRIDIPDETDQDYQYHGEHGIIIETISDAASEITGDERDARIYRVRLDSDRTIDVRWRSLRPPIDDE